MYFLIVQRIIISNACWRCMHGAEMHGEARSDCISRAWQFRTVNKSDTISHVPRESTRDALLCPSSAFPWISDPIFPEKFAQMCPFWEFVWSLGAATAKATRVCECANAVAAAWERGSDSAALKLGIRCEEEERSKSRPQYMYPPVRETPMLIHGIIWMSKSYIVTVTDFLE